MSLSKVLLLIVLPAAIGAGCETLRPKSPSDYAADLDLCERTSESWDEYTPCCESVARAYGRDPSFCSPDKSKDSGAE